MDGILKFFDSGRNKIELPGQVTVDCPASLRVEVSSEGTLPYMSSSIFINCFANNTRTTCPIPVPVKYNWYHTFENLKFPLANKSGSHFVSALDLGFELRVEIESLETEHPGVAVVTIGPIQASPSALPDLNQFLCQPDGAMLPLSKITAQSAHKEIVLEHNEAPKMYIFEGFVKIIARIRGEQKTLRLSVHEESILHLTISGSNGLRIRLAKEALSEFFGSGSDTLDNILLCFESPVIRDKAIVFLKISSNMNDLRNQVILQKIIPKLGLDCEESLSLVSINSKLQAEIRRLCSDQDLLHQRIRELQNLLQSARFQNQTPNQPASNRQFEYLNTSEANASILISELNMSHSGVLRE